MKHQCLLLHDSLTRLEQLERVLVLNDEQKGEPKGKGGEIESGQRMVERQRQGQGQRKGQTTGKKKPGTYNSAGVSDLGFEQRVPQPRVKSSRNSSRGSRSIGSSSSLYAA